MTRWSLFLQTLSLLHHFLGLYWTPVLCHFDDGSAPKVIRLRLIRDEVIAV